MRELTSDRALHAVLRALGIKNPGAVNVQVPVNLVELVGDSSQVTPPLAYSTYGFWQVEAAVVAELSCHSIRAGAGGLWFLAVQFPANDQQLSRDDALALTGVTAIVPEQISGPIAPTAAICNSFHMTAAALGINADSFRLETDIGIRDWPLQFYLGPGERVIFANPVANNISTLAVMWREVPPLGG